MYLQIKVIELTKFVDKENEEKLINYESIS